MSNSITPNSDNLASLLGNKTNNSKNADLSLADLMKNKLVADNLAKGFTDPAKQIANTQDDFSPSAKGLQAASMVESFQSAYAYSETMSLQIQTKEGDVVTVDFRQLYAQYQEQKTEQSAELGPKGAQYFESKEVMEATYFEERFGFSVQGDLNDDELAAIFKVFEQVDELANNFFDGNIEKAFQQAVDLEVDFGKLQSIDLNLVQTETYAQSYQQAAAYQSVGQNTEQQQAPAKGENIADLSPYLQKMQEVIANLDEQFEDARNVMEDFMASVTASRFPDQGDQTTWLGRIKDFHEQLLNKIDLTSDTTKPVQEEVEKPAELGEPEKVEAEIK